PLIVPNRRRPRWHDLRVADVVRLTDQAVALTFDVPADLRDDFTFEPGQYVTLRTQIEGQDVRRSYSICMSRRAFAETGQLRVASARVAGGAMSNWLNDSAAQGQTVQVMSPMGDFVVPTDPDEARHHVAVAAGSGITPVLSLIATALDEEPQSQVTLIFGNKTPDSVMFSEELSVLEREYPGRFTLIHVLSQASPQEGVLTGRIDRDRMRSLLDDPVPARDVDHWYVCGPHAMVLGVEDVLAEHDVPSERVHHEIFHLEESVREGR
ncbi:MAG: FAD-binding oxidoreductase, partial [Ornithinimicrobium sp.]